MSDKRTFSNFVDGEHVGSADGTTYDVFDPTTGEVYGDAPVSAPQVVDRAVRTEAGTFES